MNTAAHRLSQSISILLLRALFLIFVWCFVFTYENNTYDCVRTSFDLDEISMLGCISYHSSLLNSYKYGIYWERIQKLLH